MTGWTLAVARTDLTAAEIIEHELPRVGDGDVLLRVDRVGMTANNVTYAVLGEAFHYWDFFPAPRQDQGVVPLWGFADIVESKADRVEAGGRVYGYLPSASHLLLRAGRADARGFRDESAHRRDLPAPYNNYALTTGDPAYEAGREDLHVLYRPLFYTSYMLADQLLDNDCYGAAALVFSSASSKTAYGAAFELQDKGPRLIGLTSPGNVKFTASLGCYDEVISYDDVETLPTTTPTAYVDFAGSADLRRLIHEHLADALIRDIIVGITQQDAAPVGTLRGPRPSMFFAPDQIKKRTEDWGRDGLAERFAAAWRAFAPTVESWVDVIEHHGRDPLRNIWLAVLAGKTEPRDGHVVTL